MNAVPPSATGPDDDTALFAQREKDDAVADGNVQGQGSGKSARDRLNALRNMLVTAADLLAQGDVAAACVQLQDAANRTDGASPPSDFVQGPAAADLFDAITALRGQLGCSG